MLPARATGARLFLAAFKVPLMRRATLLFPFISAVAFSQSPVKLDPVKWTAHTELGTNGEVDLKAMAVMEEGWHVYALTLPRNDGPLPTIIANGPSSSYVLVGSVVEVMPEEVEDPTFAMLVLYHSHKASFGQRIKRNSPAAFDVKGTVEYMACNDHMCLPPVTVPLVFKVEAAAQ